MSWRLHAQEIFNMYPKEYNNTLTDVYAFGVFTGESVYDIKNIIDRAKLNCKSFHCLDSFIGLPKEDKEDIPQESWNEGGFNASKALNVNSVDECIDAISKIVYSNANFKNCKTNWIPGFFSDSLNDFNREKYDMGPALYVDIDVDLYSSSFEALDFLFKNKLIRPGTIIGYDDWGGTPGWFAAVDGESRAHKEMCQKYNVVTSKLCQFGSVFPHVHVMFIVNSIGR